MVYEKLKTEGGSVEEEKLTLADLYYTLGQYAYNYEKSIEVTEMMLK
jgi:hypothetical protein